ncbi:MAG: DUF2835 family protein [Thioalkalivibrio sp.]|nr:MAG: DUF2835 family protein [Thioalkalivibrio sp.]
MREFRLRLSISPAELLLYYRGEASVVVATARDGTSVQMPARLLRPHVATTGVSGEFLLRCDERNRFLSLERIGD